MKYTVIDRLTNKPIAMFDSYDYVAEFLAVRNCPIDYFIVLKNGMAINMGVLFVRVQCVRASIFKK